MEGHGIVDKHAYVAGCILYPFLFFLFFFFFFSALHVFMWSLSSFCDFYYCLCCVSMLFPRKAIKNGLCSSYLQILAD